MSKVGANPLLAIPTSMDELEEGMDRSEPGLPTGRLCWRVCGGEEMGLGGGNRTEDQDKGRACQRIEGGCRWRARGMEGKR